MTESGRAYAGRKRKLHEATQPLLPPIRLSAALADGGRALLFQPVVSPSVFAEADGGKFVPLASSLNAKPAARR